MQLASVSGRIYVGAHNRWLDVAEASGNNFPSDAQSVYERWDEFRPWAAHALEMSAGIALDDTELDPPIPRPRQVFAVGMNYGAHVQEAEKPIPDYPVVFTKFPSSLIGHGGTVRLPSEGIDWEVELVAVVGRESRCVPVEQGWEHVAGLTVGQDLSWREVQYRGPAPQYSIAKSYPGFSPLGPYVVTLDELPSKDDLGISCVLDGEVLQSGRTTGMIFTIPQIVSYLSHAVTLYPGDLIYSGSPPGVGQARSPQRFLVPGRLDSHIEGIGTLSINLRSSLCSIS